MATRSPKVKSVTISRLKNTDELKQISGHVLNQLCNALNCTPNDLIEFTSDDGGSQQQELLTESTQSSASRKADNNPQNCPQSDKPISVLTFVSPLEVLESA